METEGRSKLKILYLLDILEKESDDEHKLTMKEIEEKLLKNDIKAERKSINRDIKLLQEYGFDIIDYNQNREGYFLASRNFDVSELRLLIDAVLSAKFISLKQTKELLDKLKNLTSINLAKKLESQLYIDERIKTNNEHVYENVDKINEAININKQLSFKYYKYNMKKEFVEVRPEKYIKNPYSLAWQDDRYYMICGHAKYDRLEHYRVDRMRNIVILDEKRRNFTEVCDYKNNFDTGDYINKAFNMFTGEKGVVKLKFKNELIDVVIEKFGESVPLKIIDDKHFEVRVQVLLSEGFIGWIMQLGAKVEILYPEKLREKMKEIVGEMYRMYE